MNATACRGAAVVLLVLSAACGSSVPTSPTGTPPPPSVTLPPPSETLPTSFPPLSGPSRTFVFERELAYPVSHYTKNSRFVLYDNGAFTFHYYTPAGFPLSDPSRGSYAEENGLLNFTWGPCCEATGRLEGISLKVQYSEQMQWNDYEDAVYVLIP